MGAFGLPGNNKGMVLITGLMFMAVLMTIGTTAVVITSGDVNISRNYNNAMQAFNNAESGVQYALGLIEDGLANNTFTLPQNVGDTVQITDPATDSVPGSYRFSLSLLTLTAFNRYQFTSTGDGRPNPPASTAQAQLDVTLKREAAINYGAFGDTLADMKASGSVYSYDSGTNPNPVPGDSTGEGDVGSNGSVSVKADTFIDGTVALGNDGTSDATLSDTGGIYSGPTYVGEVDPDPLGVNGGEYATKFTTYSSSNDNNLATGDGTPIVGDIISLDNAETMTLNGKPGGANYYISDLELKNGSNLIIDTSAGPVNIFLTGALEAKNGSAINMTGLPTEFAIFSNSSDSLIFKHGSTFKGLVYAPNATVEMKNSADVYGAIWADTADIKSTGELYYDTALQGNLVGRDLSIAWWENLR